jgi:hypothetical protein
MEKKLGKIINIHFGLGGYQDAQIGIHLTLGNNGWGVNHSHCAWDEETVEWSKNSQWSEEDRDKSYSEILRYVSKLLNDAKVSSVDELKGIPVEVTTEGNILIEWRILTEVL